MRLVVRPLASTFLAATLAFSVAAGPSLADDKPSKGKPAVAEKGKPDAKPADPQQTAAAVEPAATPTGETARVELKDAQGKSLGVVVLEDTPNGVLITADLVDVPAGVHAFHIHETGKCEGPDFKSAGGHFNPGKHQHGIKNKKGMHAGDLPNVEVPEGGKAHVQVLARDVSMKAGGKKALLDADGAALVLHAEADDFRSDPAGNAGGRIACGVITK